MVLGNALCALNLVSTVMANGVCCYYEMHKEEERKKEQEKSIRQAIQEEWERQRFVEMMNRQHDKDQEESHHSQRVMMRGQALGPITDLNRMTSEGELCRDQTSCSSRPEISAGARILHSKGYSFSRLGSASSTMEVRDFVIAETNMNIRKHRIMMSSSSSTNKDTAISLMKQTSLMDSDEELEEVCVE